MEQKEDFGRVYDLSIKFKILLVPAVFVLLQGAMLVFIGLAIRAQAAGSVVVGVSGRQGMLAQRFCKEIAQGTAMGDAGYANASRDLLRKAIHALLDGGTVETAQGEAEAVPPQTSPEIRRLLAVEREALEKMFALAEKVAKMAHGSAEYGAGILELFGMGDQAVRAIDEASRRIESFHQAELNAVIRWLAAALFASVVIGAVFVVLITRRLLRPLEGAVRVMEAVAGGDLTKHALVDSGDEIGRIGLALNTAIDSMRGLLVKTVENALKLSAAADEITTLSGKMSRAADGTAARANSVSSAAEQVSHSVQTVAAAAEQMASSVKEVSRNASNAAEVAGRAVDMAGRASASVSKLGEASSEIGKVIKLITSVAEQTNLLALNATIEAARAGEAGKGFAVVAGEVKDLAKETGKATEVISEKIGGIQSDVSETVSAIGKITKVIQEIAEIQSAIAGAVEQQAATISEIGRNALEGATGSREIAEGIMVVAKAAQDTSSDTLRTREAAGGLVGMAAKLNESVVRFKLTDGTGH